MLWTKCVFVVSVYTYLLLLIDVATVSGMGGTSKIIKSSHLIALF